MDETTTTTTTTAAPTTTTTTAAPTTTIATDEVAEETASGSPVLGDGMPTDVDDALGVNLAAAQADAIANTAKDNA